MFAVSFRLFRMFAACGACFEHLPYVKGRQERRSAEQRSHPPQRTETRRMLEKGSKKGSRISAFIRAENVGFAKFRNGKRGCRILHTYTGFLFRNA